MGNNVKRLNLTAGLPVLLLILLCGCSTVGSKSASISVIYLICAVLSLLVFAGYIFAVKNKSLWFIMLLCCVFIINTGYYLLSISPNLKMALISNEVAYFGSVFLSPAMLFILFDLIKIKYKKWLPIILMAVAVIMFIITASSGYCGIYYKEVYFERTNGVSSLLKIYGPLHVSYLVYLLGYFSSMICTVLYCLFKKKMESVSESILIALAVFVNLGVWFIEQMANIDFEMLSVSYIISELFLLGILFILEENKKLKLLADKKESGADSKSSLTQITKEKIRIFEKGVTELTPTEHLIFDMYINKKSTKEIMAELDITENTLKFHNKNIYAKLSVKSKKELVEIYKNIQ